jgi:RNA polymerase sigma-70 factor (ECF subfamily)
MQHRSAKPEAGKLRQIAFATAYRMQGDPTEAEDVAQDAMERWLRQGSSPVAKPEAFIATAAARLALNRIRNVRTRQSRLKQQPLPVPLVGETFAATDAGLDLAYGVVALSRELPPLGRAVVILRDGFDLSFAEIAEALGRTAAGCRQAYARAKKTLAGQPATPAATDVQRAPLLQRLTELIRAGSVAELSRILAEDIVLHSDGGRSAPAIARLLHGKDRIARFLIASPAMMPDGVTAEIVDGPQGPFLLMLAADRIVLCVGIETDGRAITALYALSDPEKLAKVSR